MILTDLIIMMFQLHKLGVIITRLIVSIIALILPQFVSYLRERGVLCVGNGSHFCTPVLMNICNITFQILRLSTFVFKQVFRRK